MADRGYSRPDPQAIPFAEFLTYRSDDQTKDSRFVNVVVEPLINPVTQETKLFVVKRDGLAQNIQPAAAAGVGRGVYYWERTGATYSVVGTTLYKGTSSLQVLNTSTGPVSFSETQGATPYLVLQDGTDMWVVETSDTVTEVTDVDAPTPMTQGLEVIDGYTVAIKSSTGEVYNSDVDNPLSWTATNFLSPEMFPDKAVALSRYRNLLIVFGSRSTEFFYDAANATGSPFSRVEQMAQQIGCAAASTVARERDMVFFVGQTQYGRAVYTLEKDRFTPISDGPLNRILNEEGSTDIASADAMIVKIQGRPCYVLSLNSLGASFVYDPETKIWTEISTNNSGAHGKFSCIYSTDDGTGKTVVQHRTDGYLYKMNRGTYTDDDSGGSILVDIITNKIDGETNLRKFVSRFEVMGDFVSGATLNVQYSDDDYATWSTARALDMSRHMRLSNMGSFRRRALRFTHSDDTRLRLEKFEFEFDLGEY